jgi:hypothetical protein
MHHITGLLTARVFMNLTRVWNRAKIMTKKVTLI